MFTEKDSSFEIPFEYVSEFCFAFCCADTSHRYEVRDRGRSLLVSIGVYLNFGYLVWGRSEGINLIFGAHKSKHICTCSGNLEDYQN